SPTITRTVTAGTSRITTSCSTGRARASRSISEDSEVSPASRWAPRAGALLLCTVMPTLTVLADEAGGADEANLAMQLSNPVAALISVPMQLNYDQDIG